jgi:orotate phosphoribosyltransferase
MTPNPTLARQIARMLLEIKAIRLSPDQPFHWSSGWNSPIYCDNRLALSYPDVRTFVKHALSDLISSTYPDVEAIAGVATAGIPQGVLVADEIGLPFIYVRPEPKKHGLNNQIEGHIEPAQRVVIVEDLVSTGGSSLRAADALREAGANILGMVAIFTYGFETAERNFSEKTIELNCLSDYSALLDEAAELNYIRPNQLAALAEWRQNPAGWGV